MQIIWFTPCHQEFMSHLQWWRSIQPHRTGVIWPLPVSGLVDSNFDIAGFWQKPHVCSLSTLMVRVCVLPNIVKSHRCWYLTRACVLHIVQELGAPMVLYVRGSCDPTITQLFSKQWCVSCCVHAGPTMLAVYSGGPLDISWAKENDNVTAILQSFFPAQTAGSALALVLTGGYNPAGRLPNTWPASLDQVRESLIPILFTDWNWTMLLAAICRFYFTFLPPSHAHTHTYVCKQVS